ncbi:MAG: hypothetical protein QNJ07_08890 [Woeseiaceae bacterium]|nr:hypothetical protein [Woeseiaceae bacterium]
MKDKRRLAWTLVAIVSAALAFSGLADETSAEYAEAAFKRALVTFAVARTLNGVISVAQGTEVAVEPGGVGVNFTVGQILDPINDLVEQFSSVMLVATSSLGLQNVLLNMTGWWGLTVLLAIAAAALIAVQWWPLAPQSRAAATVTRVFLVALFLRFAIPVLVVGSTLVFDTFLAAEQDAATAALKTTSTEIEALSQEEPREASTNESLLDRLGNMIDESMESLNVADRIERLRDSASNASEHIVNLIVIFVLQTIILPLAFLWMFVEGLKALAARTTRL